MSKNQLVIDSKLLLHLVETVCSEVSTILDSTREELFTLSRRDKGLVFTSTGLTGVEDFSVPDFNHVIMASYLTVASILTSVTLVSLSHLCLFLIGEISECPVAPLQLAKLIFLFLVPKLNWLETETNSSTLVFKASILSILPESNFSILSRFSLVSFDSAIH